MSEFMGLLAALPPAADYVLTACVIGLAVGVAGLVWSMRPRADDRLLDEPKPRHDGRRTYRDRRDLNG